MTLIDKVITKMNEDSEADIDAEDFYNVKDAVADVEVSAKSLPYIKTTVEKYGTGFKIRFEPNDSGLINLENGIDEKLVNELGWEKIDSERLNDGTVISYYK